jgi:hypothetical protein
LINGGGCTIKNTIVNQSANGNVISADGNTSQIINNTVYSSTANTGAGVYCAANSANTIIANNYIEGFSGAGGKGISIISGAVTTFVKSNRYYNNTSHESFVGIAGSVSDNSAVASSALTNPGAGDFSAGTDLKAGAYPTTFKGIATDQFMDIGAAQREEPAGGGGGRRPRIRAHGV